MLATKMSPVQYAVEKIRKYVLDAMTDDKKDPKQILKEVKQYRIFPEYTTQNSLENYINRVLSKRWNTEDETWDKGIELLIDTEETNLMNYFYETAFKLENCVIIKNIRKINEISKVRLACTNEENNLKSGGLSITGNNLNTFLEDMKTIQSTLNEIVNAINTIAKAFNNVDKK